MHLRWSPVTDSKNIPIEMRSLLNTEPNNNDLRINEHKEMVNCSNEENKEVDGEEFDISDSELKDYKEAVHKLLKYRNYKVKAPNGQFRCPFCVGVEKQGYHRLLEHAVRVAEGSIGSGKERANHSAMAKYLAIDLAGEAERLSQSGNKMQLEMFNLDFEKRRQWLNSWEEELNKRAAALTEEKRKMDDLIREKNDCYRSYQHHLAEERRTNDELLEAGKELMKMDLINNQMAEKLREAEENYRGLVERLKEKEAALSNLEDVKEQKSNGELQEVRLELVKLMSGMPRHKCVDFGVKTMGEIYENAIKEACKKRFPRGKAKIKAVELRIFLEKKLRENPDWQPYKIIEDEKGNPQGFLKMPDEQLQGLEDEFGEQICNAVYTALIFVHKCEGRYKDAELWNLRENRKATLTEVISYISTHLNTLDEESNTRKRLRRCRFVIKQELPHS